MEFASSVTLLNHAYDAFLRQQWIRSSQTALPVVAQMNRELFEATRRAHLRELRYRRQYLSRSDYLLLLYAQGFTSTSLNSVTAVSWNKHFNDIYDSHTFVGSLIRNGKMYGERDRPADPNAVRALAFLSTIIAKKLSRPGYNRLVINIPSSINSSNTLPQQLAGAVALMTDRYELAHSEALTRCRDIGQMKNISNFDERMRLVKGSMHADPTAVRGRDVLLIDDLLGSGGTLREAARALKAAGASEVHALVMAKTRKYAMETMCKS